MKYCNKCGAPLKDGVRFCNKCGATIGNRTIPAKITTPIEKTESPRASRSARTIESSKQNASKPNNSNGFKMLAIALAVIIVVVGAVIFVRSKSDSSQNNKTTVVENTQAVENTKTENKTTAGETEAVISDSLLKEIESMAETKDAANGFGANIEHISDKSITPELRQSADSLDLSNNVNECITKIEGLHKNGVNLFDTGSLFTAPQKDEIERTLDDVADKTKLDAVIVTTNGFSGKTAQAYADDIYDNANFRADGVLLVLNMSDRELYISTSGLAIRYITDNKLNVLQDNIIAEIQNGNNAGAASAFAEGILNAYAEGIPDGQANYNIQTGQYDPYSNAVTIDDYVNGWLASGGRWGFGILKNSDDTVLVTYEGSGGARYYLTGEGTGHMEGNDLIVEMGYTDHMYDSAGNEAEIYQGTKTEVFRLASTLQDGYRLDPDECILASADIFEGNVPDNLSECTPRSAYVVYRSGEYLNGSKSDEYVLWQSSQIYLENMDVELMDKSELRFARNEIYARHGRIFTSADLQNYFNSKSWYHGSVSAEAFNDNMLSAIEKANVKLIESYEAKFK
ncbi:MAG: YARHG domain-containing protein [Eubacteriales bacterium]|nr:YARHG domain-containing protein [Eubacteriales bacterium]